MDLFNNIFTDDSPEEGTDWISGIRIVDLRLVVRQVTCFARVIYSWIAGTVDKFIISIILASASLLDFSTAHIVTDKLS